MKKTIMLLLVLILSITLLVGCGSINIGPPVTPTVASGTEQPDTPIATTEQAESPDPEIAKDFITSDAARALLQSWVDSHPFQLGSVLEPECDEFFVDGVEYYRFVLSIIGLGKAEILVHKETGEIFHFDSPYSTQGFEPVDDWYNRDHAEYAPKRLTVGEAMTIYNAWLRTHDELSGYKLSKNSIEEYELNGEQFHLFHANDIDKYWYNILVHMVTGELFFMLTPDGLDTTVTIEPLDDWYNRNYGDSYDDNKQNEFLNEVLYKGIPVGLILDEQPESTLGAPLESRGPFYVYEGMELYYTDYVSNIWGYDLSLFEIDGVKLNITRSQLHAAFGSPVDYYEYPDSYTYSAADDDRMDRYHVFSYIMEGYMLNFWFESDDGYVYIMDIMRMGQ